MYSTLLYDLVTAGIPVGVLSDLSDFGEGLVVNGMGEPVSSHDVQGMVTTLQNVSADIREARREKITASSGDLDSVMETW